MLAHNEARQTAMVNMYNTAIQYLPTSRASMHADNSLPESVCKCVLSTVVKVRGIDMRSYLDIG